MSESKTSSFPWAGLAVVLALVSSTFIGIGVFDPMRPAEKERGQPPSLDLEIDARLWEDPFAAMRRAEAERLERCKELRDPKIVSASASCNFDELRKQRAVAGFHRRLRDVDRDAELAEVLLLGVLVPGNPFVGAEENRRRTRYAVLAGLQAKNFVPDNPERIGLLQVPIVATSAVDSAQSSTVDMLIPYEMLSERPLLRGDAPRSNSDRFAQVALLWIDENALPGPKLNSLAALVHLLVPCAAGAQPADTTSAALKCADKGKLARLALIGPSSSDGLRLALRELKVASQQARAPAAQAKAAVETRGREYATLATATLLNTAATASDSQLEELNSQKLENFLSERFREVIGNPDLPKMVFTRLLATDSQVLRKLVDELELRIAADRPRRVVLVAERDSLYAQALVSELKHRMRDATRLQFEVWYYFRGADGATTREPADGGGGGSTRPSDGRSANATARIEWPETRDQLDYLRRMAAKLKDSQSATREGPIVAIGILGSDVHDKLLALQALHDVFADKVFFTTDIDARFLHPRTQSFTRNLIVASSLPLHFPVGSNGDGAKSDVPSLHGGNPPFRDMYQSAAYLAARRAACRTAACIDSEERASRTVIGAPSIYEIGRNRAMPLSGYAFDTTVPESNAPRAIVAGVLFTVLLGALLLWPSTPALRRVRALVTRRDPGADAGAVDMPTGAMVATHVALLTFTLCSLVEFVEPGYLGFIYIVLLSALAGFVSLLVVFALARPTVAVTNQGNADQRTPPRAWFVAGALVVTALAWSWIVWRARQHAPCNDCEQVIWLEGVSAWPSQLIHLLTLVVIVFGLDYAWTRTSRALQEDCAWLCLPASAAYGVGASLPEHKHKLSWLGLSPMGWHNSSSDAGVDLHQLWLQYATLASHPARTLRTLVWYGATAAAVAAVFFVAGSGEIPDLPVRGTEHRALVGWTLYTCLLLLPLLIVAVGDTTLLASRLVHLLNRARTVYPRATLEHAARQLGGDADSAWLQPMHADPAARNTAGNDPGARHSLLDDWLDVQLVARRTDAIAGLVIWPFAAIGLLVVARSRLFDNWAVTPAVMVGVAAYLLILVVLALALKRSAENTRTRALSSMRADLRWLAGTDRKPLADGMRDLIAAVENNRTGAFAPFFDQPLLTAILVPLGGAGGAQLIDHLLLAR